MKRADNIHLLVGQLLDRNVQFTHAVDHGMTGLIGFDRSAVLGDFDGLLQAQDLIVYGSLAGLDIGDASKNLNLN